MKVQIRRLPKPVIAMVASLLTIFQFTLFDNIVTKISYSRKQVAGYAVGGGHVLHMVCDLTIAADNAVFGQTGPKVLLPTL